MTQKLFSQRPAFYRAARHRPFLRRILPWAASLMLCICYSTQALAASPTTSLHVGNSASATAGDEVRVVGDAASDDFQLPLIDEQTSNAFAGGSGDALYICCAAGYCTYSAIEDCSLLSTVGKVVALSTAGISGLVGFGVGFAGGALLLADPRRVGHYPVGRNSAWQRR